MAKIKSLPYENAESGSRALVEIKNTLGKFGCTKFGSSEDFHSGNIEIQFEYKGQLINLTASAQGYARKWLEMNPHNSRMRSTLAEHQTKARNIGAVAVYSILRDWIKGQITAIETGVIPFDNAFIAHRVLPGGETVIERLKATKGFLQLTQGGE